MSSRGGDLLHFDQAIVRHPRICGGELVFKGTRVTLRTVLASLTTGFALL
jgi:uncharacterized protein (DUF433 family)